MKAITLFCMLITLTSCIESKYTVVKEKIDGRYQPVYYEREYKSGIQWNTNPTIDDNGFICLGNCDE